MSYAQNLTFLAAGGAALLMAGSVMAAESQTPVDAAKSQSMEATTQNKLAATDRAAAATRTFFCPRPAICAPRENAHRFAARP